MENKFKNDMGTRYLKGLFYETTSSDKSTVSYTLKDEDHLGFPSLYRLYLETNDPTEYQFAIKHLDGWVHWEALLKCSWFEPYVERWRRELELRFKSQSLQRIMTMSKVPSKEQFMANRYLLEKGWEPKVTNTKGRPTKADITKAASEQVQITGRISDDLVRLGITKN